MADAVARTGISQQAAWIKSRSPVQFLGLPISDPLMAMRAIFIVGGTSRQAPSSLFSGGEVSSFGRVDARQHGAIYHARDPLACGRRWRHSRPNLRRSISSRPPRFGKESQ